MAAREKEKPCATLCRSGAGWHKVPWHKVPRHKVGGTRLLRQGYFPMFVFIGVSSFLIVCHSFLCVSMFLKVLLHASMGQEWNRRTRNCAELDGSCAMKEEQLSLKPTGELFAFLVLLR